ncbi:MAG: ABC transporter ATP-binding protein [Tissierellaceae bacterium]|nr:ABC transporter ATP-binding protein [Tissierellaceae bacterium]
MDIRGNNIVVQYDDKIVLKGVSIEVNKGEIVTVIGPNGSGKSTLIKAICRSIKIANGDITLDGKNIDNIPTKEIAKKLAVLPQVKSVSNDLLVESLVSYGRFPHLGFGKRLSKADRDIVQWAMDKTGTLALRDRNIMTLSGGERQRAWIAMALAQKTDILVLDEPTTYLDISYQMEVLELVKELNETLGISIIMVLHDLNQAVRYSDRIYVLKDGEVFDHGNPCEIINRELLKVVFNIQADIYEDYKNNCPYIIPNKIKR